MAFCLPFTQQQYHHYLAVVHGTPIGHEQACYCCGEGVVAVRVVPQKSIACFRNKTEDVSFI